MVSHASSQKAMITSCALRLMVRSPDRKLVLASCWVIVLPPCAHAAAAQVGEQRPADAARVDSPVAVEAAVLDRDEGGGGQRVQLLHVDRRFLDRAAQRDRMAVVAQQQQRGSAQRLERARQRRGDDQPDQGDENQRRDRIEVPSASGGALGVRLRCGSTRSPAAAPGANGSGSSSTGTPPRAPDSVPIGHLISLAGLAQLPYMSKTAEAIYPDAC